MNLHVVEEQTEEIELPLHDAARRGNLSLLKEYIKEGVSGTGLDAMGNTSLYWAARAGHLDCVKELLKLSNSVVNAQVSMIFIVSLFLSYHFFYIQFYYRIKWEKLHYMQQQVVDT